ncbi:MAG: hypothetical protein QQN63_06810 [Nitrosopumilus sp.]
MKKKLVEVRRVSEDMGMSEAEMLMASIFFNTIGRHIKRQNRQVFIIKLRLTIVNIDNGIIGSADQHLLFTGNV